MKVDLQKCDVQSLLECSTHADFQEVASNPEIVVQLEELVESWCKQIEQVKIFFFKKHGVLSPCNEFGLPINL